MKPAPLRSKNAPKPPISTSVPALRVDAAMGDIRWTNSLPAAMSTPAALYVFSGLAFLWTLLMAIPFPSMLV